MLYNQLGDSIIVGVSSLGLVIPGFSSFTKEYANNKIKCKNIPLEKKTFVLYLPQWTEFWEYEFSSKELGCSLIREW